MSILSELYRPSLALLTDLYQLTMAYGYWKSGISERTSVFHLFFRKAPFQGQYAIAAGLEYAVALMQDLRFSADDIGYLASLQGNDGQPLFEQGFLTYLRELRFTCDVDAVPEGSITFAHAPLLRISGPLLQCQLLETSLLTVLNFQTLIATKAARVCAVAAGDDVLEFGLRRAQGIDGGLSASRAAFIGGCNATSNVLAGRLFGIPVRGTHAHAWVMSGFKATADPALTDDFTVTHVWVEDPWAGRVSRTWGPGLDPHTLLTAQELGRAHVVDHSVPAGPR